MIGPRAVVRQRVIAGAAAAEQVDSDFRRGVRVRVGGDNADVSGVLAVEAVFSRGRVGGGDYAGVCEVLYSVERGGELVPGDWLLGGGTC